MRETFSLWFYLGFWTNVGCTGKTIWRFPDFFKDKIWKSEYFVLDTFITPFFKLIGCKIVGHKISLADRCDEWGNGKMCVRCYAYPVRDKIKKLPLRNLPLYINDEDMFVKHVALERLKAGK